MQKLSMLAVLSTFLLLFIPFVAFDAAAQIPTPQETWQGESTFSLKSYELSVDVQGNTKIVKSSASHKVTIQLFSEGGELVKNPDGCYMVFTPVNAGGLAICIENVGFIASEFIKKNTEKFLMIGTGRFNVTPPGESAIEGIAYLDVEGNLNEDKSQAVTRITFHGKLAGGSSSNDFFFTGNFSAALEP